MKQRVLFLILFITTIHYAQVSLVKDINAGPASSMQSYTITRIVYNNELIFAADDGTTGVEIWKTDGTNSNTVLLKNINSIDDSYPNGFKYFSTLDKIVFSADNYPGSQQNYEPYFTDGSANGTQIIVEVFGSGSNGSVPYHFTEYNGNIIFSAIGTTGGRELFMINGNTNASSRIKDIYAGAQSSDPELFTPHNGLLYFVASEFSRGRELWRTDGTENGTQIVSDLNNGFDFSDPKELIVFKNELYFSADNGINGREIFKLNNQNNTVLVSDINSGNSSSNPEHFTIFNNRLYYTADNGTNGKELWITFEGTNSNKSTTNTVTQLLLDINPNGDSNISDFFEYNNKLYFAANDGTNGKELWVTDGTIAGTVMLKNIHPSGDSNPTNFIKYFDELYFNADNGTNGKELWKTDGTANGTVLVADINSQGDSDPLDFAIANNRLLFSAFTNNFGRELYKFEHPSLSNEQYDFDLVNLFPNPTKKEFTLQNNNINKIEIYNINGKKVKVMKASNTYDISELISGIYFIKIYNEKGVKVSKLIKN